MKETDLTQMNRLEQMLKEAGIPYEREDRESIPREEVIRRGYDHFYDRHEIFYPDKARHISDVVCFHGTYGWEDGLLEQMGLLPDCEDTVQGYLTAEEVFERWKKHYEEVLK